MSLDIRLLGKPTITGASGERRHVRGHQAWALLARILLTKRALDRRTIAAELFPDTDDPLGSLRWCLASLRRALGSAEVLTGDPILRDLPNDSTLDVLDLEAGNFDVEVAGDLLDGIEPRFSTEFSTWLLVERERVASLIDEKIRQVVLQAISVSDYERAIRIAELGVRRRSLDEGAHILLVKSLSLAGRREAALTHVAVTEQSFLTEIGERPTAALRAASLQSRAAPPEGISPQANVRSLIQSGLGALTGGAVDVGIERLRQAADEAEKCQDRSLHAQTLFELGSALVHTVRGFDDEGAVQLRRSVELARQCGSRDIAAAGLREIGYVEAFAGRRPAATSYLAEAIDLIDDSDSLSGIHGVIGFNLVDWGKLEEGLEHYGLALDLARSAGNRRRQVWALGIGALGHMNVGDLETAKIWLIECLEIVDDLSWVSFRPWPVALLAETRLRGSADPRELRPVLEQAFALSCQLGDPCWESHVARTLAMTYGATGDHGRAMEWFLEARERCVRETDIYAALRVRILSDQAEAHLAAGEDGQAKSVARELLSLAARAHMDHYVHRAISLIET